MTTADAVQREADFLAGFNDGLPPLLTANGGPWDIVQAYWRRTPPSEKTAIYVLRSELQDPRVANIRIRPQYAYSLKLHWPVRATGEGIAEAEQQNLDNAVDLLITRIRGFVGDKTHGGRFLSVAEVPRMVHVAFDDPEVTIPQLKALKAVATYNADDLEINE